MQPLERDVRGIRMRWLEAGSGSPVVFVHGIPTSPILWRHVLPLVEARCLAFEMVGYGDSIAEGFGRHVSVSRQADHMLDWLEALGIERAVFVGHDLGGGVAQIAAVRRPHACGGLVLVNAIAYDSWPIPAIEVLRSGRVVTERLPKLAFRWLFRSLIRAGHDDARVAGESFPLHWRPYSEHGGVRPFVHQIRALHTQDTLAVADALPRLDVPARVVWGEADGFQTLEYGERLAHDLRAPLRRLKGAKHFVPEDHPEAVADAVREVLAEPAHAEAAAG